MAKFKKKIVSPGVKNVGRLNGSEEKDAITPARIKSWVENTKKLKELGVLIPAPFAHQDKNKKFAFPVIVGKDKETLADAYSGAVSEIPASWDLAALNAGFWDTFDVDPKDGSLIGEVDIPDEEKAKKVGKEIKQTSILVMPGRRVIDRQGAEHEIGEHLAHVALCLHAQEPGQPNFEPLDAVPASLAMSFVLPELAMDEINSMSTDSTPVTGMGLPNPNAPQDPELYSVISLLRSALNVALPEDVTRENFLQSLKLVLTQKLADQRANLQDEGVTQRPNEAVTKSPSIAMTQTVTPPVASSKVEALLMSQLVGTKKKALQDRVQKLVQTGRVSKKYADETLLPKITAFSMSAADLKEDGSFPKTMLEELLDGLEESVPLVGESLTEQGLAYGDRPQDGSTMDLPDDIIGQQVAELDDKTMDELVAASLG